MEIYPFCMLDNEVIVIFQAAYKKRLEHLTYKYEPTAFNSDVNAFFVETPGDEITYEWTEIASSLLQSARLRGE